MTKATGYDLREAIKRHTLLRDAAQQEFKNSLMKFPSEDKPKPAEIMRRLEHADEAICKLEVLQQWYNQQVRLTEPKLSLAFAVKMVGTVGRHEKLLRDAHGMKSRHEQIFYGRPERTARSRDDDGRAGAARGGFRRQAAHRHRQGVHDGDRDPGRHCSG